MENLPVRLFTWFALIFDLAVAVAGLQKNNDFPLLNVNHAMLIHLLSIHHLHWMNSRHAEERQTDYLNKLPDLLIIKIVINEGCNVILLEWNISSLLVRSFSDIPVPFFLSLTLPPPIAIPTRRLSNLQDDMWIHGPRFRSAAQIGMKRLLLLTWARLDRRMDSSGRPLAVRNRISINQWNY